MRNEPAPELPASIEWINCAPAPLQSLRGYVTLIAFWSAGSAYCHNLLEDLQKLQQKFSGALQIIALHTPKFDAERDPQLLRKTCNQLGIGLRVAHDPDFIAWQHFGIAAWPTVAVVDALGVLRDYVIGDRQRDTLEALVIQLVGEGGNRASDVQLPLLRQTEPRTALAFPTGLCVTERLLYVADTGHHSILECTFDGRVMRRFGSGTADFMDGNTAAASFRLPRGLSVAREILYVADTGNHALRRIRLSDGDVLTVAGSGSPGQPAEGEISKNPRTVTLNRPWDVAAAEDRVFIAMAGCNQIWALDRLHNRFVHLAGSGVLGLRDGDGRDSAFAQPAGLALVHSLLYVADSAGSAVRSLQTSTGKVQTLLGQGLFAFGDTTGQRAETKLQYPLALVKDPDSSYVWVLDSYNNAIKKMRLGGGEVLRFDIEHKLQRPSAMAIGQGSLWIANTDAHEVLRVDATSGAVRRLPIGE
jgi:sugar lactone lactonase YvrE/thiol-disulfide isomerase/thioredoxin